MRSEWGTTFGQEVAGYSDTCDNPNALDAFPVHLEHERAGQELAAAVAHGVLSATVDPEPGAGKRH